eukprot:1852859-Amphidinium_carterae.2
MAHHQDQQGPPEQADPANGSSASPAPGLGGSVDLAQLHVSLLQVVNQAITHTGPHFSACAVSAAAAATGPH